MMNDIQAAFRDRFTAAARQRVSRIREVIADPAIGAATVMRELHTFAGEAGLLGFTQFVGPARTGEEQARRLHAHHSPDNTEAVLSVVRDLERLLDELAAG